MNEHDPTARVLASADALIRRHRVFLAGAATAQPAAEALPDQATTPFPADAADLEDIPVLTEVVEPAEDTDHGRAAKLLAQRQRLEAALAMWLDEQLPLAVLRITDGWNDQLIAALTARMREDLLPQLLAELAEAPAATGQDGERPGQP